MNYPKLTIKKTENENEIDESRLVDVSITEGRVVSGTQRLARVSAAGSDNPITGRALFLDTTHDWVIGRMNSAIYAVPLKK